MGYLFLLVLVICIVGFFVLKRGENLRFETSAAPQETINLALATAGTGRRWTTLSVTETTGSFAYRKRPSLLIGFGLMFFFLVPGLVYFILAGKREAVTVTTTPSGAGYQVQVVSNGFRGKLIGRDIRRQALANGSTVNQAGLAPNMHGGPQQWSPVSPQQWQTMPTPPPAVPAPQHYQDPATVTAPRPQLGTGNRPDPSTNR